MSITSSILIVTFSPTLSISLLHRHKSVHYVLHFNCHLHPTLSISLLNRHKYLSITSSILIVTFHPHTLHICIKPSQVCVHYVLHFNCHLHPHTLHISIKPSQVCVHYVLHFNCHLHPTLSISLLNRHKSVSITSSMLIVTFSPTLSISLLHRHKSVSITSSILIVTFIPHTLHISIKPSQVCPLRPPF